MELESIFKRHDFRESFKTVNGEFIRGLLVVAAMSEKTSRPSQQKIQLAAAVTALFPGAPAGLPCGLGRSQQNP